MTTTAAEPCLTFEKIWQAINGYQKSAALKTACELDLFSAIARGHDSPAKLAAHLSLDERAAGIFCDFLTIHEFLTKGPGNRYALAPASAEFLDKQSPMYLGGSLEFLLDPELTGRFNDLRGVLQRGGGIDKTTEPENPMWVTFARAMFPLQIPVAQGTAAALALPPDKPYRMLDIAAGHGAFGIAFARSYPQSTVVELDWKSVLDVARQHAKQFGVADRLEFLPGDAFTVALGNNYDVVYLANFLHHFDERQIGEMLARVHAALKPGGKLAVVEFVPNEDRITPPQTAAFALTMLAGTKHGNAYTFAELDGFLRKAGFGPATHHPLPPTPQSAVITAR
jgi:2-polyprenyl-3-methyl-5-hydroxy-6-metoxy-1,4-benzoquinol methylase